MNRNVMIDREVLNGVLSGLSDVAALSPGPAQRLMTAYIQRLAVEAKEIPAVTSDTASPASPKPSEEGREPTVAAGR